MATVIRMAVEVFQGETLRQTGCVSDRRGGARESSMFDRFAVIAAVLGGWALFGTAQAARFDLDSTPGRLSKDILPTHYQLEFELDPQLDTFKGRAEIALTVRRPTAQIVLNAKGLAARSATLVETTGATLPLNVDADQASDVWRLSGNSRDLFAPGAYRLRIEYDGQVERRGQGLFRVDYSVNGQANRMLATQLEPTHARAVFPAFDEPAFRATFDIAISAPARFEPVSNMPVMAQESLADGRRRVQFARTPPMPTYLVALAVGEFDALQDSFEGIPLRILTARGRSDEARYAMRVTQQVLAYFRDYFGIEYMLPKLDQLAIPGVRGGAMEDWGAISYNENLLLFEPQRSPPRQQQTIFNLVAHEIAHQWFGNLVTAAWWDDIWLNEAFATWIAAKAQDHFNPTWKVRVRERLYREKALERDAGTATRAIAEPPAHESGIHEVFDEITYAKGGAVLGMFESYLGAEVFRDGLRRYLAAHRYSNATTADLWFHLSRAAGRDITPMINDWIEQPGFPLIKVRSACGHGRTVVDLTQERFAATRPGQRAAVWRVPVIVNAGKQSQRLVVGREPRRLQFAGCVPVVANGGDIGYYRVLYDTGNVQRLRRNYGALPAEERIGLAADTLALARSGRAGFADYFALLEAARGETEGAVWQEVIEGLEFLDRAFAGTSTQIEVRSYGKSVLAPVLARLGWEPRVDEDPGTLRLRNALIDVLGQFDDPATRRQAQALFAAAQATPSTPLEPSIRAAVVRTVARHADAAAFEALRKLLRDASNQEDKHLYGGALIGVRDRQLVQRLLDLTLTDEWPPGDAVYYAREVGAASGQPTLASAFVLNNFPTLRAKASIRGQAWLLPRSYAGYNDTMRAEELLVEQRRLVGTDALGPAEQIAVEIRDKATIRARDGARMDRLLSALNRRAAANLTAAQRSDRRGATK